jgi:16S rRNA (uracil1498-N3)-methyltransferase
MITDETPPGAGSKRSRQQPLTVLVEALQTIPRPARTLTLMVPGCKGDRLQWLVEKGTELGVSRFILTEFEHSVVHTGPQHVRKLVRTAIEACKQCRRAWLPQMESGLRLSDAVETLKGTALLAAHPEPASPSFASWLSARRPQDLAVVIGPEGGLIATELEAVRCAGGQTVRLGKHTLRVETAAIAAAACWASAVLDG